MRAVLQVYAVALGAWVAVLFMIATVKVLIIGGAFSSGWVMFEIQPWEPFGPKELWRAWGGVAAVLFVPPGLGSTAWLLWRGRRGHAT
jgi:hypothetical protein